MSDGRKDYLERQVWKYTKYSKWHYELWRMAIWGMFPCFILGLVSWGMSGNFLTMIAMLLVGVAGTIWLQRREIKDARNGLADYKQELKEINDSIGYTESLKIFKKFSLEDVGQSDDMWDYLYADLDPTVKLITPAKSMVPKGCGCDDCVHERLTARAIKMGKKQEKRMTSECSHGIDLDVLCTKCLVDKTNAERALAKAGYEVDNGPSICLECGQTEPHYHVFDTNGLMDTMPFEPNHADPDIIVRKYR